MLISLFSEQWKKWSLYTKYTHYLWWKHIQIPYRIPPFHDKIHITCGENSLFNTTLWWKMDISYWKSTIRSTQTHTNTIQSMHKCTFSTLWTVKTCIQKTFLPLSIHHFSTMNSEKYTDHMFKDPFQDDERWKIHWSYVQRPISRRWTVKTWPLLTLSIHHFSTMNTEKSIQSTMNRLKISSNDNISLISTLNRRQRFLISISYVYLSWSFLYRILSLWTPMGTRSNPSGKVVYYWCSIIVVQCWPH